MSAMDHQPIGREKCVPRRLENSQSIGNDSQENCFPAVGFPVQHVPATRTPPTERVAEGGQQVETPRVGTGWSAVRQRTRPGLLGRMTRWCCARSTVAYPPLGAASARRSGRPRRLRIPGRAGRRPGFLSGIQSVPGGMSSEFCIWRKAGPTAPSILLNPSSVRDRPR